MHCAASEPINSSLPDASLLLYTYLLHDISASKSASADVVSRSAVLEYLAAEVSHPDFRGPKPGREINTGCAGTKSHTYDE
jgi:hypothetical protein